MNQSEVLSLQQYGYYSRAAFLRMLNTMRVFFHAYLPGLREYDGCFDLPGSIYTTSLYALINNATVLKNGAADGAEYEGKNKDNGYFKRMPE